MSRVMSLVSPLSIDVQRSRHEGRWARSQWGTGPAQPPGTMLRQVLRGHPGSVRYLTSTQVSAPPCRQSSPAAYTASRGGPQRRNHRAPPVSHTSRLPDHFLDTPDGETSFTDRIEQGDVTYSLDEVVTSTRQPTPSFPTQDTATATP